MPARTRRQLEIFEYITTFIERHGYEPSYQQIARHFRIASKSAIAKHIAALEERGLLRRQKVNGKFALTIQPEPGLTEAICSVPLYEKLPGDQDEKQNSTLFVPRFLFADVPPEKMYAFRVPSDSMIDEHICAGDIALIERKALAKDGDCVVALIENRHPTLERFYDYGTEIELRPSNSHLTPMRLPFEFIRICGIFRALLRSA